MGFSDHESEMSGIRNHIRNHKFLMALKLRIRLRNFGSESLFGDVSNSRALKYFAR